MKYNIFQGNEILDDVVADALGYEKGQENSWFTEDIYFETFFYLTKRFGQPKVSDEYKDAGEWNFSVKNYTIKIILNSSWVSFIVYGDYRLCNRFTNNTYWVKRRREELNKKDKLIININDVSKRSSYETEQIQNLLNEFQVEKNIPDDITNEQFNSKYGTEFWIERVRKFNENVLSINYEDYEKYGTYTNSKTRHALKTLRQFINNMLTPIWIRDVSYNIKGKISNSDAYSLSRFEKNIDIKLI